MTWALFAVFFVAAVSWCYCVDPWRGQIGSPVYVLASCVLALGFAAIATVNAMMFWTMVRLP